MPIDIEALLQPIPGGDPCGADLRYQPLTDQIKEARREEADLNQGVWKRDVKTADYPLVLKLCKEALGKRGKDLQIAGWLTEALLRQEGYGGLRQGLGLIQRLLETYWDGLYPRPDEDGDLELRATPLRWVGMQLDAAIRSVPLTRAGHDWFGYRESRSVPTEEQANNDSAKQGQRAEAMAEGKLTPEEFQRGFDATPNEFSLGLHNQLGELLDLVASLGAYCDQCFGEAAPDFGPLRRSLEEVHQTARILIKQKGLSPEAAAAPEEEEAALEEAAPESASPEPPAYSSGDAWPEAQPAAAPVRKRAARGAEPASADDAVEQVLAAARYLRKENPSSPGAYMVTRALRWGELRAAGYPDPAVMTAPPTEIRVALKRLAGEGAWDQVLEIAEEAAGRPWGRAWLDVQRYAVFGARFAGNPAVAQAILSGLKSLLADLPQLLEWSLADETPVANAETVQWMKDQGVLPGPTVAPEPEPPAPTPAPPAREQWYPPPPPPPPVSPPEGEPLPPDAYELAMEAARAGRTGEALDILTREISQERSGRGRFLRRVQLAQVCMATGNSEIGSPILQELAEEVERRALEDWEGADLVAQPLALLYRCLGDAPELAADKRKLYARICRLDPSRALGLR